MTSTFKKLPQVTNLKLLTDDAKMDYAIRNLCLRPGFRPAYDHSVLQCEHHSLALTPPLEAHKTSAKYIAAKIGRRTNTQDLEM